MRELKGKRKLLSGSQQMLFHLKWKEKSFNTRKVAIGNLTDNQTLSWSQTKTCLTYKQECCFSHQKNTSEVCLVLYTWPNKEHDCIINVLFKFWGLVHYVTGVQYFITHASQSAPDHIYTSSADVFQGQHKKIRRKFRSLCENPTFSLTTSFRISLT